MLLAMTVRQYAGEEVKKLEVKWRSTWSLSSLQWWKEYPYPYID